MKLLLLLDYDGTLVPIKKHPKLARLSLKRRSFLRRLAKHPGLKMAIISGRRLADLKRMVNLPDLIYIGNHGYESEVNGRIRIHPAAKRSLSAIQQIKQQLLKNITIKGVWLEDKGLTLSLHYRQMPRSRSILLARSFSQVFSPWKKKLKMTAGKKVLEVRPLFDWDKGKAVKWVIRLLKLKRYFPIYIGDDRTDEDAFRALKRKGLTLKVGAGGRSAADRRLRTVPEVYRFLSRLVRQ